MRTILAIDPGNENSAFVFLNETLEPIDFGIMPNGELLNVLDGRKVDHAAIEMVASYGMPVGETVFETVFWIGRFWEVLQGVPRTKVYRKDVKMNLCKSMRAKDSNIRQALVDRFARHDLKNGKGTKKNPDWFYGFRADMWAAYAVGITYHDLHIKPNKKEGVK